MKIFTLVFFIALAAWYGLRPGSETSGAENFAHNDLKNISPLSSNTSASRPARHPISLAARTAPDTVGLSSQVMSEDDFISALRSTNMGSVINVNDLVQKLRLQEPQRLTKFFSNRLSAVADSNSVERGRLFQLANAVQSDALLPFWQDLALRTTPAYPNETALISAPEPTFDSRVVLSEMAIAVRNLGLISFRNPAAADTLKTIAIKPNKDIHSTLIRQYAYEALKEADQVAGMQIVRALKKDDPLKSRLISDARSAK
jgi:hypothetical protein